MDNLFVLINLKQLIMKGISLFISFGLFLFFNPYTLHSQHTIVPAGNDITSSGGSISYTLGQVVYNYNSGSDASTLEGVQQPYEISIMTLVEPDSKSNIIISLFPNPTTDRIIINISEGIKLPILYNLIDITGKEILSGEITQISHELNTKDLPASVYFLHLIVDEKLIATHKIIKS